MSDTRSFQAPNLELSHLSNSVVDWFKGQDFSVQKIDMQEGGILVQAKRGGWRNAVGMASALNVALRYDSTTLTVEIGAGKWLDKAAVGAVSMVLLWPLAVAAAYGAWQQSQLPNRAFEFIQQYISVGASQTFGSVGVTVPNVPDVVSTATSSATPPSNVSDSASGALKFCPSCGASVSETDRFCSSCGHSLT